MTMAGNVAKLVSSEVCQKCAKCCKEFTLYDSIDNGLRFKWMENKDIQAKDTPFVFGNGEKIACIKFNFPCKRLYEKEGKYYCKDYNDQRPFFCGEYPDNQFYTIESWNTEKIKKVLQDARIDCPALKNIAVKDVVKMLKERRGETDG